MQFLKGLFKKAKPGKDKKKLKSGSYSLRLPLAMNNGEQWKPYPIFKGATTGLDEISCHVSALAHNFRPHPPHEHDEEEVLVVLSGEVHIFLKDPDRPGKFLPKRLQKYDFVYYPSLFSHTIETVSQEPANYLMFKWRGTPSFRENGVSFGCYQALSAPSTGKGDRGFRPGLVFEGATQYLEKLQCHTTLLDPGAGYPPHTDHYDVAILLLEGEVHTLGQNIKAPAVIFYSAGQPHGMLNPTNFAAQYLVFEFWTSGR